MTQPVTETPPQQGNAQAIIAAAAIGLALIAVESSVRQDVEQAVTGAATAFTAALVIILIATRFRTGTEVTSNDKVHKALTKTLDTAERQVTDAIEKGYTAAAQVALSAARTDLARLGYTVPDDLPVRDQAIDAVLRDLDTMFTQAHADIQNSLAAAFDSSEGDPALTRTAVDSAADRLMHRASKAAATAVYRGSGDAQQALFAEYQNSTGARFGKRWTATSATPCGMCAALDGTVIDVGSEFDHTATLSDADYRPVWRNLFSPPRHPNCRCQLELVALTGRG